MTRTEIVSSVGAISVDSLYGSYEWYPGVIGILVARLDIRVAVRQPEGPAVRRDWRSLARDQED
jgi:hypothetical protein